MHSFESLFQARPLSVPLLFAGVSDAKPINLIGKEIDLISIQTVQD
ncbi:hypothetical protein GCM10009069_05090 [Algimonas arctica]|uniref:Uncharacterized protein n=1 Tax=Algimonas arctica TaxID=1479486 RepID=A0A8J3G130_9PROT|nr:hypothetical protein GCM10009069_05090 [Algimonas arctica]